MEAGFFTKVSLDHDVTKAYLKAWKEEGAIVELVEDDEVILEIPGLNYAVFKPIEFFPSRGEGLPNKGDELTFEVVEGADRLKVCIKKGD